MSQSKLQPLISSLVEINDLIRRQTEEKTKILDDLFSTLDTCIKRNQVDEILLDQVVTKIHDIHKEVSQGAKLPKNDGNVEKLQSINKVISSLDMLEEEAEVLKAHRQELNESIKDRDELIGILSEYVDLGHAQNYKLISEISEIQSVKQDYEKNIELYSQLSQFDPRIKAISILEKHPHGISSYQMMRMLDIPAYEARRIINELLDLGMIFRREGSEILHYKMNPIRLESIRR